MQVGLRVRACAVCQCVRVFCMSVGPRWLICLVAVFHQFILCVSLHRALFMCMAPNVCVFSVCVCVCVCVLVCKCVCVLPEIGRCRVDRRHNAVVLHLGAHAGRLRGNGGGLQRLICLALPLAHAECAWCVETQTYTHDVYPC